MKNDKKNTDVSLKQKLEIFFTFSAGILFLAVSIYWIKGKGITLLTGMAAFTSLLILIYGIMGILKLRKR